MQEIIGVIGFGSASLVLERATSLGHAVGFLRQFARVVRHNEPVVGHWRRVLHHQSSLLHHYGEFLDNETQFNRVKGLIGCASLVLEWAISLGHAVGFLRQFARVVRHTEPVVGHWRRVLHHQSSLLHHYGEFLDNETQFDRVKGLIGCASLVLERATPLRSGIGNIAHWIGSLARCIGNMRACIGKIM